MENDSGFLTEHQDISGKADKTELDNYLPYTTGTADSAKNIHWETRLNSFLFDIESTKPSIEFDGDRVGSATITPNKIELNGNSESGTASILLDGKPVALQENIPTKLSQLEQDVESGGSGVIANGVCDDYAEPLERIEIDGKKYTTLNKKKVEYVTAHFEEGKFSHTLQDIADSSLPVFITNLTSGIEFELRIVYHNDEGFFVFIADGDLMDSITNYFDSLGIGGCYERDIDYLTFIENTCCGEGDELKIEYYNHQSSVYCDF